MWEYIFIVCLKVVHCAGLLSRVSPYSHVKSDGIIHTLPPTPPPGDKAVDDGSVHSNHRGSVWESNHSHTHASACVRMSHRGRAFLSLHALTACHHIAQQHWLERRVPDSLRLMEVNRCEWEGPTRGRAERREANKLKLFVFSAGKPSVISLHHLNRKGYIVFTFKRYRQTVCWDLLETAGHLFRGTAMTCHLQSLIPVLGLCIPFVTLIFSTILILSERWITATIV